MKEKNAIAKALEIQIDRVDYKMNIPALLADQNTYHSTSLAMSI
jgi:hypothetical protein